MQLSSEHQARIETLAFNMGIKKGLLLEDVVAMGIGELEDFHIAAERAAEIDRGEADLPSWDEVVNQVALDR